MVVFAFFGVISSASVSARILNSSPSPQPDAQQLARDLFQNEIQAESQDQSLWCYRERSQEHGEKELFAVCQTSEGEIDRLLEVNGQELNPKQRQAEDQDAE